jgi:hypothetical protein
LRRLSITDYQYFESNTIFVSEQYGLKNNSSTELATYNSVNNILSALNIKLIVGGVYCEQKLLIV